MPLRVNFTAITNNESSRLTKLSWKADHRCHYFWGSRKKQFLLS